jgi:hypothetical protein
MRFRGVHVLRTRGFQTGKARGLDAAQQALRADGRKPPSDRLRFPLPIARRPQLKRVVKLTRNPQKTLRSIRGLPEQVDGFLNCAPV